MITYPVLKYGKKVLNVLLPRTTIRAIKYRRLRDRIQGVSIDIADGCNLKCKMCVLHSRPKSKERIITDAVIQQVVASAPSLRYAALQCNCEPLLNKDAPAIVKKLKASNPALSVSLVTNGMLLTKEMAEAFLNATIDEIGISIDGATTETFENLRVGANMERIISNVKTLVQSRNGRSAKTTTVRFVTVSSNENKNEILDILHLAGKLGVDCWTINGIESYLPETASMPLYAKRPDDQIASLFKRLGQEARVLNIALDAVTLRHKSIRRCFLSSAVIDTCGNVYPCPSLSYERTFYADGNRKVHTPVVFGNLIDKPLLEIWNGKEYKKFRRTRAQGKLGGICEGCLIKDGVICPL